ncbi:hypothetical protein [Kluyvera georgiana]|uniref:hypothetical protein n=1 Tax=Kluyvera georgiana TaxID=73098 RepID=UPI003D999CD2
MLDWLRYPAFRRRVQAELRATEVVVLPLTPESPPPADNMSAADRPVKLDGR